MVPQRDHIVNVAMTVLYRRATDVKVLDVTTHRFNRTVSDYLDYFNSRVDNFIVTTKVDSVVLGAFKIPTKPKIMSTNYEYLLLTNLSNYLYTFKTTFIMNWFYSSHDKKYRVVRNSLVSLVPFITFVRTLTFTVTFTYKQHTLKLVISVSQPERSLYGSMMAMAGFKWVSRT